MTLQSSASTGDPLYMSEVETELGLSGTIYLDQSQVRTLFGVPSGTIYLLDGLGKSYLTALRPNAIAVTGFAPANPTYAYDTTAAVVDTSTASTYTRSSNTTTTHIYTFAAGTKSGTLRVAIQNISTGNSTSVDTSNTASSSVSIQRSIDGSSYLGMSAGQSFDQVSYYDGQNNDTVSGIILTKTLTNQNMANLKIAVTAESARVGSLDSLAIATAIVDISDIVIY